MKTITVLSWGDVPIGYTGKIQFSDGYIVCFKNGLWHRADAPAYEDNDGNKEWYLNDKRHRAVGPAVELSNGTEEYWIHGKQIENETAYWLLVNMMKLKGLV